MRRALHRLVQTGSNARCKCASRCTVASLATDRWLRLPKTSSTVATMLPRQGSNVSRPLEVRRNTVGFLDRGQLPIGKMELPLHQVSTDAARHAAGRTRHEEE